MRDDFEVVWNGVNDGHDGDLLVSSRRIPDKQVGARMPRADRAVVLAGVLAVLPLASADALTLQQLVHRSGASPQSVNGALYQLRLRGVLASEVLPGHSTWRARPPQRYWRVA